MLWYPTSGKAICDFSHQRLHRMQHTSDVNAYVEAHCRHSQHQTCIQCLQVNGDAFIGRTFDNGDDFKRLNFTVSEVSSSSAAWVQVRLLIAFELLHPGHYHLLVEVA